VKHYQLKTGVFPITIFAAKPASNRQLNATFTTPQTAAIWIPAWPLSQLSLSFHPVGSPLISPVALFITCLLS